MALSVWPTAQERPYRWGQYGLMLYGFVMLADDAFEWRGNKFLPWSDQTAVMYNLSYMLTGLLLGYIIGFVAGIVSRRFARRRG